MPCDSPAVYETFKNSLQAIFADYIVGIISNNRERVSSMGAATSKPARRGRPPLKSGEAKRASFNTRLRNALKEHLEESARAAGRSLSEEIESRLERSFDRTESLLGGREYDALFQMMVAAARVIEARLGKSPFSDPEASAVARNAWRQIIHNLTSNPLEAEIVTEELRILDEMTNLKPPALPSPKVYLGFSGFDQISRNSAENMDQYLEEQSRYENQILEYQEKLKKISQKMLEFADVANEAAKNGLSFPKHR
jgi:Arc-like DNA binding domain